MVQKSIHTKAHIPIVLSEKDIARFHQKYRRGRPDECWEWTGSVSEHGYGRMILSSRSIVRAHRIMIALDRGDPGPLISRHTCHNRICVNPNHLLTGTHQDKSDDKMKDGRYSNGDQKGEANPRSKLKESDVLEIAALLPVLNNKQIAKKYGVTHVMISRIRVGKSWSHLTGIGAVEGD